MDENKRKLIARELLKIAAQFNQDDHELEMERKILKNKMEKFEKQILEILVEKREKAKQFYEIVLSDLNSLLEIVNDSKVLKENPNFKGVRQEFIRMMKEEVLNPLDAYIEYHKKQTDGIQKDITNFGKYADMLKM